MKAALSAGLAGWLNSHGGAQLMREQGRRDVPCCPASLPAALAPSTALHRAGRSCHIQRAPGLGTGDQRGAQSSVVWGLTFSSFQNSALQGAGSGPLQALADSPGSSVPPLVPAGASCQPPQLGVQGGQSCCCRRCQG